MHHKYGASAQRGAISGGNRITWGKLSTQPPPLKKKHRLMVLRGRSDAAENPAQDIISGAWNVSHLTGRDGRKSEIIRD